MGKAARHWLAVGSHSLACSTYASIQALCFKHKSSAQVPGHDLADMSSCILAQPPSICHCCNRVLRSTQSSHLTEASVVPCVQQVQQGGTSALQRPSRKRLAEWLPPAVSDNSLWLPNFASWEDLQYANASLFASTIGKCVCNVISHTSGTSDKDCDRSPSRVYST